MGLDMYLSAERYFWFNETKPVIEGHEVKSVKVEAAYWRKANHIHAWFVREVQDGEDECQTHSVPREKLVELRGICADLLRRKDPEEAMQVLPPQTGFFFGGTEITDWYWKDLQDTVEQIDKALEGFPADKWEFEYRSSW